MMVKRDFQRDVEDVSRANSPNKEDSVKYKEKAHRQSNLARSLTCGVAHLHRYRSNRARNGRCSHWRAPAWTTPT